MKKKVLWILGMLAVILLVIALLPAKIDCGNSERYTFEDREAAAQLVVDKIGSFEGCKLFAVKYDGDDVSQENLNYCNGLAADGKVYTDCIVLTSYFRSPIFGGGAWNANEIYSWSWYLARIADEPWEILTYGYA